MKSLLLVAILSFTLIGCDDGGKNDELERRADPLCDETKSSGCRFIELDWLVSVNSTKFPKFVILKLHNKIIRNECSGQLGNTLDTARGTLVTEFRLFRQPYAIGSKTAQFEVIDCEANEIFFSRRDQPTNLRVENGQEIITIAI